MKKLKIFGLILGIIALSQPIGSQAPVIEKIIDDNVITVATFKSPSTLYNDSGESFGVEYELANGFSKQLGVRLNIKQFTSLDEIYRAVEEGEADFAAANLIPDKNHYQNLRVSIPYQLAEPILVYRDTQSPPESLSELAQKGARILLAANSFNNDLLNKFQTNYKNIHWIRSQYTYTDHLLDQLRSGQAEYVVLNLGDYERYRPLYPELKAGFRLTEPQAFRWVFSRKGDDSLYTEAHNFLSNTNKNDDIEAINNQLYSYLDKFNQANAKTFQEHIKSRLPTFKSTFEKAAEQYDFDWRLLAAISYQESTWNPRAVSPTGVSGLMMLTKITAHEVGIKNRNDPEQSIFGGAAYLRKLVDREPEAIDHNQKIWFSLAAYNAGYGLVMDARRIAKKQGADPYNWFKVKDYISNLQGGYRNKYVANIRRYYELLLWSTMTEQPSITSTSTITSPLLHPVSSL